MKESTTFHAFTATHNGITDRIITPVSIYKAFDPSKTQNPSFQPYETSALWDTGATKSVITHITAQAIGLVPVGITTVNHAGGSSRSNTYIVNIWLPNKVGFAGVLVSECPDVAGNFGAIIGMDIIMKGDLSLTNFDGQSCMTFRTPSMHKIDYVADANRLKFSDVNRNAPCPCGKKNSHGKPIKFKNCCRAIV